MCESTESFYVDGDIVWVKLGPCWWPGEVWGENRVNSEDLKGFKKRPIAIVKFFQEDSFEYVRNFNNIYKYNCSRKDEFIRKGLDMYRAKNKMMEKFPGDLGIAEEKTGGNPNIVDCPEYAPNTKTDYKDLFGTPDTIKNKKKGATKVSPSNTQIKTHWKLKALSKLGSVTRTPDRPAVNITHPRFSLQGGDIPEHEIRYLESPTTSKSPITQTFKCPLCDYKCNRLNVIIIHTKQSHSTGTLNNSGGSPVTPTVTKAKQKSPKDKSTPKGRPAGELAHKRKPKGSVKFIETSPKTPKKRGRKSKKKEEDVSENNEKLVKKDVEIKSSLLADWGDDSDEEPSYAATSSTIEVHDEHKASDTVAEPAPVIEDTIKEKYKNEDGLENLEDDKPVTESETALSSTIKERSCFDFEEEEEVVVISKSAGRKIPRLITKKTKKEFEYTIEPDNGFSLCENKKQPEKEDSGDISENAAKETENSSKAKESLDADLNSDKEVEKVETNLEVDFKTMLDETKLPEIPFDPDMSLKFYENKPREIMSPKERAKRNFKSNQIFKSRMQQQQLELERAKQLEKNNEHKLLETNSLLDITVSTSESKIQTTENIEDESKVKDAENDTIHKVSNDDNEDEMQIDLENEEKNVDNSVEVSSSDTSENIEVLQIIEENKEEFQENDQSRNTVPPPEVEFMNPNLHNDNASELNIKDISANKSTVEKCVNELEFDIDKNLSETEMDENKNDESFIEEKPEIISPLKADNNSKNIVEIIDVTERFQENLKEIIEPKSQNEVDNTVLETPELYDITREEIPLFENDEPMNTEKSLDKVSVLNKSEENNSFSVDDFTKGDSENKQRIINPFVDDIPDNFNTLSETENNTTTKKDVDNTNTIDFLIEETNEENRKPIFEQHISDQSKENASVQKQDVTEEMNLDTLESLKNETEVETPISGTLDNTKEILIEETCDKNITEFSTENDRLSTNVDKLDEKVNVNTNAITINIDNKSEEKTTSLKSLDKNETVSKINVNKEDAESISESNSNILDTNVNYNKKQASQASTSLADIVKDFSSDIDNENENKVKSKSNKMSQNISLFKSVEDDVDKVQTQKIVENKYSSGNDELSEETYPIKQFIAPDPINIHESTLTEHDFQVAATLMAFKETEPKKDVLEIQTISKEPQTVVPINKQDSEPLLKIDFHSKIDESNINDAAECLMNFSETAYSENNHEKNKKGEDDLPIDVVPDLLPISQESESNVAKVEEFINLFSSQTYSEDSLIEKTNNSSTVNTNEFSEQLLLKLSEKAEPHQGSTNTFMKSEPKKQSPIRRLKSKTALPTKLSDISHTQSQEQGLENIEEDIPVHKIINEPDVKDIQTPKTKIMDMLEPKRKIMENVTPSKSSKSKVKIISNKIIKPPTAESDEPKEKILNRTSNIPPKKQFVIKMKSEKSTDIVKESKKRTFDQIDDIQTFIIERPKSQESQITLKEKLLEPSSVKSPTRLLKKRIIRKMPISSASSTVPIQPSTSQTSITEESIFDINSMPIVLSDELLTAENINNMPIVLSTSLGQTAIDNSSMIINNQNLVVYEQPELSEIKSSIEAGHKVLMSPKKGTVKQMQIIKRPIAQATKGKLPDPKPTILNKNQKIYNSPTQSKLLKTNTTIITQPGKPGKFIVVPSSSPVTGTKYTVGKRPQQKHVLKQITSSQPSPIKQSLTSKVICQGTDLDSSGNTVMVVTNAQGVQTKVVLTPEQQKLLFKGQKVIGTKSSVTSHTIVTSKGAILNSKQAAPIVSVSNVPSQMILTSRGQVISSAPNTLTGVSVKNVQTVTSKIIPNPIKQKSITANLGQTILTSKGQLITPGSTVLTSTGQIIQQTQQVVTSKGNILTPLTPAQMKQFKSGKTQNKIQIQNQKVIVNSKKPQFGSPKPSTSTAVRGNQKMQPAVHQGKTTQQISKSGPIIQKVINERGSGAQHVKLSSQQIAKMEELGYIDNTANGKIINANGLKYLKLSTQPAQQSRIDKQASSVNKDKKIIVTKQPSRKIISNFKDRTDNNTPGILQSRLMSEPKQLSRTLLLKNQTTVPPLAPISDTSSPPAKKQKLGYDVNTLPDLAEITNSSTTLPDTFTREEPRVSETIVQKQQEIILERTAEIIPPSLPEIQAEQPSTLDPTAVTSIPDGQLLAVPGENFGGPQNSFYLCSVEDNGNLTPIDNQPLYLDSNNQLVPAANLTPETTPTQIPVDQPVQVPIPEVQQSTELMNEQQIVQTPITDILSNDLENQIVINADGQQIVLTQQNLLALTEQQILTTDGEQLILQGSAQQILAALAGQDLNLLTGQQILLNEQFTNFEGQVEPAGNKDILAAALANTNVFQNENVTQDMEGITYQTLQNIEYKHSSVSETSTTLNQPPIMSPLELPSTKAKDPILKTDKIEDVTFGQNLDDSLAVIGVNARNVPTSLDLPITVTNPKIAPKTTDPLKCDIYHQSYNTIISKEIDIFHTPQSSTSLEHHFLQNDIIQTSYQNMPSLSGDESEKTEQLLDNSITNTAVEGNEFLIPDTKPSEVKVDEKLPTISSEERQIDSMEADSSNVDVIEPLVTASISMPLLTEDVEAEPVESISHGLLEPLLPDITEKHTPESAIEDKCSLEISNPSVLPETQTSVSVPEIPSSTISIPDVVAQEPCVPPQIESMENKTNTDSKFSIPETQINIKDSDIFDTESEISEALPETVPKINTDESEILSESAPQTELDVDRTPGSNSNSFDSTERISNSVTSELNIITQLQTDQLNIGAENSELLTPETIPETEAGSPPNSGTMQNYCDSSNSDEIPLQPKLVYTPSEDMSIPEECEKRLNSDGDSEPQSSVYENTSDISLQQKLMLSRSEDTEINENVHNTEDVPTSSDLAYEHDFVNTKDDELYKKRKREEDTNESATEDDSGVAKMMRSPKRFKFDEER